MQEHGATPARGETAADEGPRQGHQAEDARYGGGGGGVEEAQVYICKNYFGRRSDRFRLLLLFEKVGGNGTLLSNTATPDERFLSFNLSIHGSLLLIYVKKDYMDRTCGGGLQYGQDGVRDLGCGAGLCCFNNSNNNN